MKKIFTLMLTAMLAGQCLMAQVPDGIKYLNYDKNNSAKEAFQKAYDANPKDPQTIYWLGQALLATDGGEPKKEQIIAAKALYQKGLQEVGSDPWLLVGMGHVEILEGGNINSVKQKFEQAITATTETKGKNKGKPSAAILNAIGRSNAEVSIAEGDHTYAIDKLKQAAAIDLTSSDIYINMGINYLKLGGENGGEAVKAYEEAIRRDPKNARAIYQIGKIYQSQNNKEQFEQFFNNSIAADPAFPPTYFAYYLYYANRDVNKAKEYLDKFIATADKDPANEFFLADYLLRAGRYAESLAKAKELEASAGLAAIPRLNILYAYNYDRLNDSVQAKNSIEKFFATAPADKIDPPDYELAVKVFSKFPGSEKAAIGYIEKAIASDTSKINKMNYMSLASDLLGKAKMYPEQVSWIQKRIALKGFMSEADHYALTVAALNSKDYPLTFTLAKTYMVAYPDTRHPYRFFKLASLAADPDTTKGIAIANLGYLDSVYASLNKEKYKVDIFRNQYFIIYTYINQINGMKKNPDLKPPTSTSASRTEINEQFLALCQKAIDVADSMLTAFPDPADDNNKFAVGAKAEIQKNIDYYSKPQAPVKKSSGGAGGATGKGK